MLAAGFDQVINLGHESRRVHSLLTSFGTRKQLVLLKCNPDAAKKTDPEKPARCAQAGDAGVCAAATGYADRQAARG